MALARRACGRRCKGELSPRPRLLALQRHRLCRQKRGLRNAANAGSPAEFVRLARAQMGEQTLLGHALSLVAEGRTTIEEAARISVQLER